MNIKKLVKMARSNNPNKLLAQLSMHWAKETNKGNPVKNAVSLWRWRWITWTEMVLFLICLAFTIPHSSDDGLSGWIFTCLILGFVQFICWICLVDGGFAENRDAKMFIEMLTVLEAICGNSVESWTEKDNLQERAHCYLKEAASKVEVAEKIEKEEIERQPWVTPSYDKSSYWVREKFERHLSLLTTAFPLPKTKSTYFSKPAEVPAQAEN